jgi:hypothetical protein
VWRAEPDVFYCATHTELVVKRALSAMRAHRRVVGLETLTDDCAAGINFEACP